MYTTKQIDKAGRLLSDSVARALEDQVFAQSVYSLRWAAEHPWTPPTRRQVWVARLHKYRDRIDTAIEVLRGQHDCGDWD